MNAGTLRQRIELQRATQSQNETGEPVRAWKTYATIWAAVEPLSGREMMIARQVAAETTTRFRVRHRPGVLASDRIRFDSKTYEVEALINRERRNVEFEILAHEIE